MGRIHQPWDPAAELAAGDAAHPGGRTPGLAAVRGQASGRGTRRPAGDTPPGLRRTGHAARPGIRRLACAGRDTPPGEARSLRAPHVERDLLTRSQKRCPLGDAARSRARSSSSNDRRRSPNRCGAALDSEKTDATTSSSVRSQIHAAADLGCEPVLESGLAHGLFLPAEAGPAGSALLAQARRTGPR